MQKQAPFNPQDNSEKENAPKHRLSLDPIRSITATAMAVAIGTTLAILSKQVFGTLPVRLDLSALAVLLMSLLFGFPHGTVTYVLIDILSSIFFYPPFLPITVCRLLSGVLFDLFLAKFRKTKWKCILLFAVNALVIDWAAMSVALYWLQGGSVFGYMALRIGSSAVNMAWFLFFVYLIYPRMEKPLCRLLKKPNGKA